MGSDTTCCIENYSIYPSDYEMFRYYIIDVCMYMVRLQRSCYKIVIHCLFVTDCILCRCRDIVSLFDLGFSRIVDTVTCHHTWLSGRQAGRYGEREISYCLVTREYLL